MVNEKSEAGAVVIFWYFFVKTKNEEALQDVN